MVLRALTISMTRAAWCTMTLKTNVSGALTWEREQCFQELFVNSQMFYTTHCLHLMEKKRVGVKPNIPSMFLLSTSSPKRCCHGFDRKVVSLICIAVLPRPFLVLGPLLPGTRVLSGILTTNCCLSHEQSGVLLAFSNTAVSSIGLKVPQAEFTPAEIRGFAECGCVCVCIYLYLLHLKFHNLHWESTRMFHCVNVYLTVRVICACKCTGREAGASLNKSMALFWTISFAKKDISSSISGTTCPPSLHCADNSIIHTPPAPPPPPPPPCQVSFAFQKSSYSSPCIQPELPNASFRWWLNIYINRLCEFHMSHYECKGTPQISTFNKMLLCVQHLFCKLNYPLLKYFFF